MPRANWPLLLGRPMIEVILKKTRGNLQTTLDLLADTGGGTDQARFELVLEEYACRTYATRAGYNIRLRGFFVGLFPVYLVQIQIPDLAFDHHVRAIGVPTVAPGFGGVACFRFLNRFAYGNFGDHKQFGLET
jgi:hypothetical protein